MYFGKFHNVNRVVIGDNQKPTAVKGGFFLSLLFGLAFIAIGVFSTMQSSFVRKFVNNWSTVRAVVYDVDERYETDKNGRSSKVYKPRLRYSVGSSEYQVVGPESSESYYDGQEIEILYNPQVPGQFKIPSLIGDLAGVLFAVAGLAFIVYSAILKAKQKKMDALIKEAKSGRVEKFDGYIVGVYNNPNSQATSNGFPKNQVVVKFNDNGVERTKTLELFLIPEHLSAYFQAPTPIAVYRNPEDSNDFIIDEGDIYSLTNSVVDVVSSNPFQRNSVVPQAPQQPLDQTQNSSNESSGYEKF